jgi:hypothetical protein
MADNQQGSGFVNFDRYKNLNAFASGQAADSVTGGIDASAQNQQKSQDQAQQGYNQAVGAGTVKYNTAPAVSNQATPNPMSRQPLPGANGLNSAVNIQGSPTTNAPPQIDVAAAQRAAAGTYTGPQDLQSYNPNVFDQLRQNALGVQAQTAQLGSEYGLGSYLQQLHGGEGDYTSGMNAFDAALLGQAAPGSLRSISTKYQGLVGGLDSAQEASKNTSAAAQAASVDAARRGANAVAQDAQNHRNSEAAAKADKLSQARAANVAATQKRAAPIASVKNSPKKLKPGEGL